MSERLSNGTLVRVFGLYPELENAYGFVVGYCEDNPIVQLPDDVSGQYPYTTLVVPKQHILTKEMTHERPTLENAFEAADIFEFSIEFSNLATEWRTRFCRKIYRELIDTMRLFANTELPPPEDVTIFPIGNYNTGNHPVFKNGSPLPSYFFEMHIVWHEATEAGMFPDTRFKFSVLYEVPDNTDREKWFSAKTWQCNGRVEVRCAEPKEDNSKFSAASYSHFDRCFLTPTFDLREPVSAWWVFHQKILRRMGERNKR